MFRYRLMSTAAALTSLGLSTVAFAQPAEAPAEEEAPAAVEEAPAEQAPAASEEAEAAPAAEAETEEEAPAAEEEAAEAEPEEEPEPAEEEPEEEPVATPEDAAEAEEAAETVEEAVADEAPPSLLPLSVGTHTFSRFELRSKYDELGVSRTRFQEGDTTVFRARLVIDSNPLQLTDNIQGMVRVSPQASGQWGTHGIGGTIGEADAGIYEGYFRLKGKVIDGKVGRFAMNYGEALIIGNLDWHQAGRAFDGVHLSNSLGKVTVDTFLTQTVEGQPVNPEPFAGDTYFYGLYAKLGKALSETLELDAYALGLTVTAADLLDENGVPYHRNVGTLTTLGARAKQKVGIVDYRVEAGVQVGETTRPAPPAPGSTAQTRKTTAYHADGELGLSPMESFRVALGGLYASGDDPDTPNKNEGWNELYPTGHKFLGLMDVIGARTNVISGNLKLQGKVASSTILKLDAHVFARAVDGGLGRVAGSDSLAGYELDAQAVQKIGKWAYARGLYGVFIPAADHYISDTAVMYTEVQAGLKF